MHYINIDTILLRNCINDLHFESLNKEQFKLRCVKMLQK